MFKGIFNARDMILPSLCEKLFYAACETFGAKYVCQNKGCVYTEEWDGRECEAKHCNCRDKPCNGLMVLTINGKETEKEVKPEIEKKVCPGGRTDVETGEIMVVEIIVKEERCIQSAGCRFFIRGREFFCSCYKPKNDLRK